VQVVYKANRLTKLLKKKWDFESKLERWQDQLSREPSTPRPTVKVRKQWSDVRGEKNDVMEAISQLDCQVSLTTPLNVPYQFNVGFLCYHYL